MLWRPMGQARLDLKDTEDRLRRFARSHQVHFWYSEHGIAVEGSKAAVDGWG